MKHFLLFTLLSAGLSATAQQQPETKTPPVKPATIFKADTTGERFNNLPGLIQQRGLLPQATFSHKTSKGSIYILPVDNMPCLVPDMKQVRPMPGQYHVPDNRMPNVMPKQEIIPRKKKD